MSVQSLEHPETQAQAKRFGQIVAAYEYAWGFPSALAAQLAYVHQHGAANVDPPKAEWLPYLERLPVGKGNGWRVDNHITKRRQSAPGLPTQVRTPGKAQAHLQGEARGLNVDASDVVKVGA